MGVKGFPLMNTKNLNNGIIIIFVLLYFLSPVDFIPDTIPGVGQLDDVLMGIIAFFLFDKEEEID